MLNRIVLRSVLYKITPFMDEASASVLNNDSQNKINNPNIAAHKNNRISNYSDNKVPSVKITNNIPTGSLKIRKVVSNVLFGIGAAAAAVAIAAAVASLAFAVTFLPLAAIVGIGIASVALLTTGTILRLKKDTLSEENLPEVIKLLAKSGKEVISSNKDFVGNVIKFCDNDKVLAELFNKGCSEGIKLLLEKSGNLKVDSSDELTKNLESIKKNYDIIQSISFLKEGEKVVNSEVEEEDVKNATVQQQNNNTNILNEAALFLKKQQNKNKFNELARKHKSGITAFQLSFDKGMISSITERPEKFLKQKTNSTKSIQDKDKNYTGTHNADLDAIEKQSKMDFGGNACFLNGEKIQGNTESRFSNLENKIKKEYQNNSDEIIKKNSLISRAILL